MVAKRREGWFQVKSLDLIAGDLRTFKALKAGGRQSNQNQTESDPIAPNQTSLIRKKFRTPLFLRRQNRTCNGSGQDYIGRQGIRP
jgi:hypothetical protein